MDKSLKTKNLLRLNNEEIENLNKLKKKKTSQKTKVQDQKPSQGNSTKHFLKS